MLMVQVPPGARVAPAAGQVVAVREKSPGVIALSIVTGAVLPLVTVTVCASLGLPIVCGWKSSVADDTTNEGEINQNHISKSPPRLPVPLGNSRPVRWLPAPSGAAGVPKAPPSKSNSGLSRAQMKFSFKVKWASIGTDGSILCGNVVVIQVTASGVGFH